MKIQLTAELVYCFADATQIVGMIEAARSADQDILAETLTI